MYEFKVIELDYIDKKQTYIKKIKGCIEARPILRTQYGKWPTQITSHKSIWLN